MKKNTAELQNTIDENHDEVMTLCRQLDMTDREILARIGGSGNRLGLLVHNQDNNSDKASKEQTTSKEETASKEQTVVQADLYKPIIM